MAEGARAKFGTALKPAHNLPSGKMLSRLADQFGFGKRGFQYLVLVQGALDLLLPVRRAQIDVFQRGPAISLGNFVPAVQSTSNRRPIIGRGRLNDNVLKGCLVQYSLVGDRVEPRPSGDAQVLGSGHFMELVCQEEHPLFELGLRRVGEIHVELG